MTVYISFDGIDDIECELVDGFLVEARIGSFVIAPTKHQRKELSDRAKKEAQRLLEEENDELKVEKYLWSKQA